MSDRNSLKRLYCRFVDDGSCKHGNDCLFNHDLNESVRIPSNVCFFNLRGICNSSRNCRFVHKDAYAVYIEGGGVIDDDVEIIEDAILAQHFQNGPETPNDDIDDNNSVSSSSMSPSSSSLSPPSPLRSLKDKSHSKNSQSNNKSSDVKSSLTGQSSSPSSSVDTVYIDEDSGDTEPTSSTSTKQATQRIMSYSQVVKGIDSVESDKKNAPLCPFATDQCPYKDDCTYTHLEKCDLCFTYCLNPYDKAQRDAHRDDCIKQHEKEMEQAFAIQRSETKSCGICMDVILEKDPFEARFGILEKCDHVFCLSCIRKWRQTKQLDRRTVRSCPECRVLSLFVIPSKYWYETSEEKKRLIEDYKKALSSKPCRHFEQGHGECPFGSACFYLHAYPDGRKADKTAPPRRRIVHGADGPTTLPYAFYLQEEDNVGLELRDSFVELLASLDFPSFDHLVDPLSDEEDFDVNHSLRSIEFEDDERAESSSCRIS